MAIKRRGIIAAPGTYMYGDTQEVKTAEELRAAAERQPIITLTRGHPKERPPLSKDVIGTVSQKWNDTQQRVEGEFWFHEEKVPLSIREKLEHNIPVAISPGFFVDETVNGLQKGIVYDHVAVLDEEDPRCPLGTCGVNVRLDSKEGDMPRVLHLDQKTELAAPPAEPAPAQPEKVKVAEQKPEPRPSEPETKAPPAEQKPETKEEVTIPKKEPAPEVQRAPEVIIPVPETTTGHGDYEVVDGWVKYVPKPYRQTKEAK